MKVAVARQPGLMSPRQKATLAAQKGNLAAQKASLAAALEADGQHHAGRYAVGHHLQRP